MQYSSAPVPNLAEVDQPTGSLPPQPPIGGTAQSAEEEASEGGNKLSEITELLGRRSLLIVSIASLFILNAAWKLSKEPTVYSGSFQMLVEPANANLAQLATPGSGQSSNNNLALDYATQLAILESPALLDPVLKTLQPQFPDLNVSTLLSGLKLKQLKSTKIIEVSFTSDNKAQTQAVLEFLSNSYLKYSLNERQTYLRQGLQFVDKQLKILKNQVGILQDQLQKFRQVNGFFNPADLSKQLTDQLGSLETKRLDIQQQLLNLQFNLKTIQTQEGVRSLVSADQGYQDLLSQLRQIDTQISVERTRFQDSNITIQSLKQKRENLIPLLQQQAGFILQSRLAEGSVQIQQLEEQLKNLDKSKSQLQLQIQKLPQLTREYENLDRQLKIAVDSLTSFLESRQSLQIQAAQSEIPWELVLKPFAFAEPSNFMKELLTKILMGISIGVGVAFALDKLDGRFHTVDALKRKIKLPVLGVLPFNQQVFLSQENSAKAQKRKRKLLNRLKQQIIKLSDRLSTGTNKLAIALFEEYDGTVEFFESLRVIHTNIQQLMQEKQYKTFIVTSAMVGDGKTTFAINWADTAAVMGKKVLLIDASFRKPEIHEFLNLSNQKGLNTLMNNPQLDPMSFIQKVFEGRELYVLSAGPAYEATAAMLSNSRLETVLRPLREQFDLIIFDVPSILGLADATIFSRCTDALLMIASLHKTSQFVLKNTLDELESKNIPVLGMILNQQKGADPTLRATISQSGNIEYFPEIDKDADDFDGSFNNGLTLIQSSDTEREERVMK